MKKSVSYFFVFVLLILSASAEPIFSFNQDKFQPGETLIGEIKVESGDFVSSVSSKDINFYEGRRETIFDYDIKPYNHSYYFYAYLKKAGNFTIKVSNILYSDAEGILRSYTLEKELIVQEYPEVVTEMVNISGEIVEVKKEFTKILSIRPGVIFTSTGMELFLENKGNVEFNVTYGLNDIKKNAKTITLYPNRPEKVSLSTNNSFSLLIISAYDIFKVPLIYTGQSQILESNKTNLKANKDIIQIKTTVGEQVVDEFDLLNFDLNNISNLKITKSLDLINLEDYSSNIEAGGNQIVNFSIFSENQGSFKDNFTITFKEGNLVGIIVIPVEIYVFSENTSLENISISDIANYSSPTCADKGASKCEGVCNGKDDFASDGYCCYGECSPSEYNLPNEGSNSGWIWGIIIFGILGVGGYFIYKRTKNIKPKPASSVILDKNKSFESRISGGLTRS